MGAYAARCMAGVADALEAGGQAAAFELFAHVTTFLGFRVVLLGLYNDAAVARAAVPLASACDLRAAQVQVRCEPGKEFVKLVLQDGVLVGAMLIGDTGLEEMAENLILNRLRLAREHHDTGALRSDMMDLLHSTIDVDDFFD
ncbi:hypothetical protein EON67_04745 [archaeon]|nr:MAG: hypothetical protein EON67_04745 [archaeon]